MTTLEDQLRDAFSGAAAQVPAEIGERIRGRSYDPVTHGPRGLAAAGALGVLGLGAAGLAAAVHAGPGQPAAGGQHAVAAPQLALAARVVAAISAASRDVIHTSTAQHGVTATQGWRSQATGRIRVRSYLPGTATVGMDQSYVPAGRGRSTLTEVLYPSQEWFRVTDPYQAIGPGRGISAASAATVGVTSAAEMKALLSSGSYTKSSSPPVHGHPSYRLTRTDARTGVTAVITVSKATNLPERVTLTGAGIDETSTISWLPPTAANETLTHVAPPPGFRHVPAPPLH